MRTSRKPAILPSLPEGVRVYAVGDVHGRLDLLQGAFQRIEADLAARPAEKAIEVFLGDYVDRGPASREVLDALIARQAERELVALKGNHEEIFAAGLEGDAAKLSAWLGLGAAPTLKSYGAQAGFDRSPEHLRELTAELQQKVPQAHRDWLSRLPPYFVCGDFCFVHAGIRPNVALAKQSERDLFWIRDEFLAFEGPLEKFVVHGHTPVLEPDVRSNRINIDTGAYATNRLTCLRIEGSTFEFL